MSVTGTPLQLEEAGAVAELFVAMLDDVCSRVELAGSVRRKRPTVHDVELVCVPRLSCQLDLFGQPGESYDLLDARLGGWLADGVVEKRVLNAEGATRWGPKVKYLVFGDLGFDVFSCDAARFGWILALRTGPAAFSRQLVVPTDRRTKDDRPGLLPPTLMPRDGWLTWRTSGQRLETPEELDVFEAFGLAYVEPQERR